MSVSTENLRGRRRLETAPGREAAPRRHLGAHIRLLAQMANGSETVRTEQELGTGFEVRGGEADGKSFKP